MKLPISERMTRARSAFALTCSMVLLAALFVAAPASAKAEQLALMIHTKGKAIVKTGPIEELRPRNNALLDRGLSAEIDGERV